MIGISFICLAYFFSTLYAWISGNLYLGATLHVFWCIFGYLSWKGAVNITEQSAPELYRQAVQMYSRSRGVCYSEGKRIYDQEIEWPYLKFVRHYPVSALAIMPANYIWEGLCLLFSGKQEIR